jgi:hypothetical protein
MRDTTGLIASLAIMVAMNASEQSTRAVWAYRQSMAGAGDPLSPGSPDRGAGEPSG